MLFSRLLEQSLEAPELAAVTQWDRGSVQASGSRDFWNAALLGPYGVCAPPPEASPALMLPLDGATVCAGVLSDDAGLKPGEIRLRSDGGAQIILNNNGEISLNGLLITRDGQLISKGGDS